MIPLKYLSNFWRSLEIPQINYEIDLILTWSANFFITGNPINNKVLAFPITNAKLYVPVVTLSTQDNAKLLKQLKSSFKRTINWNKYQSKATIQRQHQYLDYSVDSNFRGVNRRFVLLFENNTLQTSYKRYFLPNVEINYYNVMINGKNFFDQTVKIDLRTYDKF